MIVISISGDGSCADENKYELRIVSSEGLLVPRKLFISSSGMVRIGIINISILNWKIDKVRIG